MTKVFKMLRLQSPLQFVQNYWGIVEDLKLEVMGSRFFGLEIVSTFFDAPKLLCNGRFKYLNSYELMLLLSEMPCVSNFNFIIIWLIHFVSLSKPHVIVIGSFFERIQQVSSLMLIRKLLKEFLFGYQDSTFIKKLWGLQ